MFAESELDDTGDALDEVLEPLEALDIKCAPGATGVTKRRTERAETESESEAEFESESVFEAGFDGLTKRVELAALLDFAVCVATALVGWQKKLGAWLA